MAKPSDSASPAGTPGGGEKEPRGWLRDERLRFSLGLFVVLFAIYLLIALVSYLFTWQADQSFEWQAIFSDSSVTVSNWAGKVGAWFAAQLMNRGLGIASLALPFLIGFIGLRLLKIRLVPLRRTLLRVTVAMLLVSLTLGFLFGPAWGFLGSGLGGAHGLFVGEWLSAFIGPPGTAFLLLLCILGFLVFVSRSFHFWLTAFVHWAYARARALLGARGAQPEAAAGHPQDDPFAVPPPPAWEANPTADSVRMDVVGQVGDPPEDRDQALAPELPATQPPLAAIHRPLASPAQGGPPDAPKAHPSPPPGEVELTVEVRDPDEEPVAMPQPQDAYDPTLDLSSYQRPPLELLEDYAHRKAPVSDAELLSNKNRIVETLKNYKIEIARILATVGSTVTLYEIVPAPGVRISRIKSLEDDIALSLSALGIRIIAPIPGRGTIGIEVPNQRPEVVSMYSILRSAKFQESRFELAVALGKTISNETFVIDLTRMPHLLVAGATGQGKSVGLNAIITSLLYKKHPAQLKFVLVDPKKVELTLYNRLERHFLAKLPNTEEAIITDTQKVINTLNSLCIEMDARYDLLKLAHVRNIKEYNDKFIARRLNPTRGHKYLPYIVVIIDEFADLIMTAGREVETPLARLAQLARAIGIHLIIATQRPTTNIITGVIKANFPARIAFRVSSMIDSRTILDSPGANQLIGRGDMLVSNGNDMIRVQCAFVDTHEIERITDFVGNQRGYASAFLLPEYVGETAEGPAEVDLDKRDDLFDEAARLLVQHQQGSTSLIQRKFSIGYNRAGRIMDQLEAAGIVGPFEGSKARQVMIVDEVSLERILGSLAQPPNKN